MKALYTLVAIMLLNMSAPAQVRFTCTNGEGLEMKKSNSSRDKQKKTLVYLSSDQVANDMEQVGVMTVKMNDRAEAIEKAKIYGSRATGDAVLLVDAKDQTAGQAVGKFFLGGSGFKGHYVFIVYRRKP